MIKFFILLLSTLVPMLSHANIEPSKYYELRIYYCHDGKLNDLLNRFRNHTTRLFEKHGMENIGYWVPDTSNEQILYYILAYPDKDARDASWKAFMSDPEWQKVAQKSEENGKIIEKIESKFMTLNTGLTKTIKYENISTERFFEMRTYSCFPEKYPSLVNRFQEHTLKLFEKHGMQNVMYFETIENQNAQPLLLYFVAHKNATRAKASWEAFRKDENWIKAKNKSEENGEIVQKVETVALKPTDFSKIK